MPLMSLPTDLGINTISCLSADAQLLLNESEAREWQEFFGAKPKVNRIRRGPPWNCLGVGWGGGWGGVGLGLGLGFGVGWSGGGVGGWGVGGGGERGCSRNLSSICLACSHWSCVCLWLHTISSYILSWQWEPKCFKINREIFWNNYANCKVIFWKRKLLGYEISMVKSVDYQQS